MYACMRVYLCRCAYACVHVCGGWRRPLSVLSSGTVHSFKKARSLLISTGLSVLARVANCPVGSGIRPFRLPGVRVQTRSIKAQVCKCGFWGLNSGPGAWQASTILAISPASRSNFLMRVSQPQFGEWTKVHALSYSRVVTHIRHDIQWCMGSSYFRESTHAGCLCYQLEDWAIAGGSLHHLPRRLPNVLMLAWKPLDGDGGQKEGRGKGFEPFQPDQLHVNLHLF